MSHNPLHSPRMNATAPELIERLELLFDYIDELLARYKDDTSVFHKDGRIQILSVQKAFVRNTISHLFAYDQMLLRPEYGIEFFGLSSITSLEEKLNEAKKFLKLSSLTFLLFQNEVFFKNALRQIGIKPEKQFHKICQQICVEFSISPSKKYHESMTAFALIRNSLHANGIVSTHDRKDHKYVIDEQIYFFKHGRSVTCASYDNICHLWSNSLDMIEKILYHPTIMSAKNFPTQLDY
jgi:hypothetical protein